MPMRECELFAIKKFLPLRIQAGDEIVEPDLAHRHQARVAPRRRERLIQSRQVALRRPGRAHRVDAQPIAVPLGVGELANGAEVADLHRRNDAVRHAGVARALADLRAVGREFRGIQVAVRVDPGGHGGMMPERATSYVQAARNRDTVRSTPSVFHAQARPLQLQPVAAPGGRPAACGRG